MTIDTRDAPANRIRRRRVCAECKGRFSTYEFVVSDTPARSSRKAHELKIKSVMFGNGS